MSQSTSLAWQKAALDTLLWLLDPDRGEAEKAYLRLFERLAVFFRSRARSLDPEELAEQTLTRVAKTVYLRLTGLGLRDLRRADMVHEVPRSIAPEVYAAERERVSVTAFTLARYALHEHYRARTREPDVLESTPLPDASAIAVAEERLRLLERALAELTREDRRLIEEYYDLDDKGKRRSRNDLAKHLGLTASALQNRAERIRRRVMAGMTAGDAPAQAQFTAYYPRSVEVRDWSTILAYMHVADALPIVQSDSRRRLGDAAGSTGRKTATKIVGIARGAQILVVPQSVALEFNPPQVAFAWLEDYHCAEFRCRIRPDRNPDADPQYAGVTIAFYVSPILVAEISLIIGISQGAAKGRLASVTAHPYQRVFVSYSHADSGIADQLEKAYKALGIEYLRDVRMLRSGEKWAPALLERIDESEIFQLLWSRAAKQSAYVRQEWQHALGLQRGFFIRPVYWDKPMPAPPRELADIHFAYLELRSKHL